MSSGMLLTLVTLTAALIPLAGWGAPERGWTPRPRSARGRRGVGSSAAGVAEAMDLLALSLEGGAGLGAATRTVAATLEGPLREELDGVGRSLQEGVDAGPSWEAAGPRWSPARRSLELAALAGVPPGPALRQAATDLRRETVARVEAATARLGVRLVVPLGLAFLPAFVLTTVAPLVLALVQDLSW
ncbi:type II secretion system F family protein [Serinicoccus kebangsaanensis]|uniref:type II secretion system F family protein n=1 Tax=Serinicoccus kebangsaanensis TaxID=2602069 RepID=UPI00124F6EAE|nr:type II secretion system F family protein [Serinicoccus kebangsaanensis]